MYYLEIKLHSGNWATIKGAKSLDDLKKFIQSNCSEFEWNIYLRQDSKYEPTVNIFSSNDKENIK